MVAGTVSSSHSGLEQNQSEVRKECEAVCLPGPSAHLHLLLLSRVLSVLQVVLASLVLLVPRWVMCWSI